MKKISNSLLPCLVFVVGAGVSFAPLQAEQVLANATSLDLVTSQPMSYSLDSEEGEQEIQAGSTLSIDVNQRVVLRSDSKKISFAPLDNRVADANGEISSDNAMKAAGFGLPTKFRAVSMLHLSVENSPAGPFRTCQVLVLDDLLDSAGVAELDALLADAGLASSRSNGVRSIMCVTQ